VKGLVIESPDGPVIAAQHACRGRKVLRVCWIKGNPWNVFLNFVHLTFVRQDGIPVSGVRQGRCGKTLLPQMLDQGMLSLNERRPSKAGMPALEHVRARFGVESPFLIDIAPLDRGTAQEPTQPVFGQHHRDDPLAKVTIATHSQLGPGLTEYPALGHILLRPFNLH
jgi:hypothetical protein